MEVEEKSYFIPPIFERLPFQGQLYYVFVINPGRKLSFVSRGINRKDFRLGRRFLNP